MSYEIKVGDCVESMRGMASESVNCCITSPPYFGLRDYGHEGQIGLEESPAEYVARLVEVFEEVKRVLRDDGTLWLNLGDSYAANKSYQVPSTKGGKKHSSSQAAGGRKSTVPEGLKPKDLIGIPWRVAFALQDAGWYLRQDIIWHKPNPMPESVRDRCTKAHEYIFLLSKSPRYYYDSEAVKEPSNGWAIGGAKSRGRTGYGRASGAGRRPNRDSNGGLGGDGKTRNKRSVWSVATQPFKGAHFAVFPAALAESCVLAGSPEDGVVLDPFSGSGTVGGVAALHNRNSILCELSEDYAKMIPDRIRSIAGDQLDDIL